MVPLPKKSASVPPLTTTSVATKFAEGSLRLKTSPVTSPALSEVRSLLIEIVGGKVSTTIATVLSASVPSTFKLPAASEKRLLATVTTPLAVLFELGVKVAE